MAPRSGRPCGRVKGGGSPELSPWGRPHNRRVTSYLSIGDFSRATHMTVKALRHYHEIRLLEPADVDPHTGYRHYSAEQIPTTQVVRRFRDLGMPLEEIRTVLAASVSCSTRLPSTVPSPRPPAAARPQGAHRLIAANRV